MLPRRVSTVLAGGLFRRLYIGVALIGAGALVFHIFGLIEFGLVIGPLIGDSGIVAASAKNGRADEARAVTDANGPMSDPNPTDIRLRPAGHWFWAPLVEITAYGIGVDLKWRNDDVLDVSLDFGCLATMTRPVEKVGPIRIFYHFTYGHRDLGSCPTGTKPMQAPNNALSG